MGLTDRKVTIKRLTFGEDWIDVREQRMYGDTVDAQRAASSRITREDEDGDAAQRIHLDISAFNLALITSMTVAWSDEGVPITEENYRKVPNDIAQAVLEAVAGDEESVTKEELENLERTSISALESPDESSD